MRGQLGRMRPAMRAMALWCFLPGVMLLLLTDSGQCTDEGGGPPLLSPPWSDGSFRWQASGPLLGPDTAGADPHVSIKDPTVVFHGGRWHLFATVRLKSGKVDIEYLSFADWSEASVAPRTILNLHDQYYSAPQVFFFGPQQRWYLIYQLQDKDRTPPFAPFYSTTDNLSDPRSWTKPAPLMLNPPERNKWLDFWVICDEQKAHLFHTSLDGHLWRREMDKAAFPGVWSEQKLALQADIFEASHTYRLRGLDRYVTIVEAQGAGRRYYKAYLADRLEGAWQPTADSADHPFAGLANLQQDPAWTANVSHGELLRYGVDERLEIDPAGLRMIFQGASDAEYRGNPYGQIPWRLGVLSLIP